MAPHSFIAGSALMVMVIVEDGVAVRARDRRRRVMCSLAVGVLRLKVVLGILIPGAASTPIAAPIEVLALWRVI